MPSLRSMLLPIFLLSICFANVGNADQELRSAFLGPDRWDDDLTVVEINHQLKDHFSEVLEILESQSAVSLKTAAERASHVEPQSDAANDPLIRTLRDRREKQITRLREYMATGTFPQNEGQGKALGKKAVPIFVDKHGTHCAVGYLMHRDGWDEQVAEIVDSNNLVYIPEIRDGAFLDWVAQSGLTREEAALIQPAYAPPEFQVTLEEMQTTMPSLTREGYTVSGLNVEELSYFSTTGTAEGAWTTGRRIYDSGQSLVMPYRAPADVGVHLGSGNFESSDGIQRQNNLESWLFFGGREFDLGQPLPVDHDSIMYRISYDIESNGQAFDEFALTSDPLFNSNFVGFAPDGGLDSALRVQTSLYSGSSASPNDANLIGELDLQAGFDDPFLYGFESVDINETQLHVETYALSYNGAVFTSMFHEFSSVPEPGSVVLLVGGMMGCFVRRRRS